MKKKKIKSYLSEYSIYQRRSTTVNGMFASAIAPCEDYDDKRISDAILFLGQDPESDLSCIYCGSPAQTWDHLVSLVENKQLRGYGHQLGNLVPCCKDCNSSKGRKAFDKFIKESSKIKKDKDSLIDMLKSYLEKFSKPINIELLSKKSPEEWHRYQEIKDEILVLMKEADALAKILRISIVE